MGLGSVIVGPVTWAVHVLVSGIVQGVGFRYWTERNARELGVSGWARNLYDGRVELVAEGDRGAVEALVERCRRGPRSAHVRGVEVRELAASGARSFQVLQDAELPMGEEGSSPDPTSSR